MGINMLLIPFFGGDGKSKIKDCLKYLEEFNEVNKFKPIKIDKAS